MAIPARTMDFSYLNDQRHKWQRYDTFQTPCPDGRSDRLPDPHHSASGPGHIRDFAADQKYLGGDPPRAEEVLDYFQGMYAPGAADLASGGGGGAATLFLEASGGEGPVAPAVLLQALREELALFFSETLKELRTGVRATLAGLQGSVAGIDKVVSSTQRDVRALREEGVATQKAVQELKVSQSVDFGNVLEIVGRLPADVAARAASAEASSGKQKAEINMEPINEAIHRLKADLNLTTHLAAVQHMLRTEIPDLAPVMGAVAQFRAEQERSAEAHLTTVLEAVGRSRVSELSGVIAAVKGFHDAKVEIDFTPVLQAVHQTRAQIDVAAGFEKVIEVIRSLRTGIDLSPVLDAIQENRPPPVDISPVLRALADQPPPPPVDLQPVLEAIQQSKNQAPSRRSFVDDFDATISRHFEACTTELREALTEATDRLQHEVVKLRPAMQDIVRGKPIWVDFSPVLQSIRMTQKDLDPSKEFAEVKAAIGRIQTHLGP